MKDKLVMKDQSVRELMELRWRINKLEEMKHCRGGAKQKLCIEEKLPNKCQSSQLFLGLRSSQAVKIEDKSIKDIKLNREELVK